MKKMLLTILYPFWIFFSKTWFGNILMFLISLALLPTITLYLIHLTFPDSIIADDGKTEGIGSAIGVLTLFCSPLIVLMFIEIGDVLETNYVKLNYKVELKMIF